MVRFPMCHADKRIMVGMLRGTLAGWRKIDGEMDLVLAGYSSDYKTERNAALLGGHHLLYLSSIGKRPRRFDVFRHYHSQFYSF